MTFSHKNSGLPHTCAKNVSLFYNIPSLFIARVKEAIALASVNGESMSKSAP